MSSFNSFSGFLTRRWQLALRAFDVLKIKAIKIQDKPYLNISLKQTIEQQQKKKTTKKEQKKNTLNLKQEEK